MTDLSQMLITALSLLQILSLPLMFVFGVGYFAALRGYKERLVEELPDVWKAERASARRLKSWMPTAYKLMQRTKAGVLDGHQLSLALQSSRTRAARLMYTAAACFMVLLFSSLIRDVII